jgi:acetamidase/formamidase
MLGPIKDGGRVVFETAPCCWGPMITPMIKGGHEVNIPVEVEDANPGDSILLRVEDIRISSRASSSGVHETQSGHYLGDPSIMPKCPRCETFWPEARLDGIGDDAVTCVSCGGVVSPFKMVHGYTMVFNIKRSVGLTINQESAYDLATNPAGWGNIPKNSKQFSSLILGKADIAGVTSRLIPFVGHLGTMPSVKIPANKNARDLGIGLVGAEHLYSITREQYEHSLTDAHMDIDTVRRGAILICPVKVNGGGVYAGDVHAQQGDGEIAGHTTDVSGEIVVRTNLIKNLATDGPLLIPNIEDLPPLAKPYSDEESREIKKLATGYGMELEKNLPIQVIGSGEDLNLAIENGIYRGASLFDMNPNEVKNRITITGGIEIGRLPGIVHITLKIPSITLEKLGILDHVEKNFYSYY